VCIEAARPRSRFARDLEESRQSDAAVRGEAKSFGRTSIEAIWGIAGCAASFTGKKKRLCG